MPHPLLARRILYGRAATAAAFSPLDLSPALWLRADSGLYQERTGASATTPAASDGDPVGTWQDQSGNARHATAGSDAGRPTLKLAVLNGQPVVRFDGTDDALKVLFGSTLAQPNHVFLVARYVTWVDGRTLFDGGDTNTQRLFADAPSPGMVLYAGSAAARSTALVAGSFGLIECLFQGAGSTIIVNGGNASTGNPGASGMTGLNLGDADGTAFGNVDIAEAIVSDAEVTGSDLAALRAYAARYGL